jgi:hypothetical protein
MSPSILGSFKSSIAALMQSLSRFARRATFILNMKAIVGVTLS